MFLRAGRQVTRALAALMSYNERSSYVLDCLVEELHDHKELCCYQLLNHPYSEKIILGIISLLGAADTSLSGNAAYVIGTLCDFDVARRKVLSAIVKLSDDTNGMLENLTKLLYSKDAESRMNASGTIGTLAEVVEGRSWLLRNPVLDETITRVSLLLTTDDEWTASNSALIVARLTIEEEGCARLLNRRDSRKLLTQLVKSLGCDQAGKGMNAGFALGRLCDMPSGRRQILMLKQKDNMLTQLLHMLHNEDVGCNKNACFALSSIAASDKGHAVVINHPRLEPMLQRLINLLTQSDEEATWFSAMLIRTLASKRHGCLLLRDKSELKTCLESIFQNKDVKEDIKDEIALTLEILKRLEKPKTPQVRVESATSAVASWEAINPKSGLEVTYHLFQGKGEIYAGQDTVFTIQNLRPISRYSYRMQASTEGDMSPFSDASIIQTPESVPSAPQRLRVVARSTSILRLAWDPPELANGILKGYQIVLLGKPDISINTTDLTHSFTHLQPGMEHCFEAYALTSAGKGEKATLTTATVDLREHAPGRPLLHVLGRNEIFVNWDPPEEPLGRISRYEVKINGEIMYSGIERNCTARGLHPGREYTFTVSAWTSEGKCESQPSSKKTPKESVPPLPKSPWYPRGKRSRLGGYRSVTRSKLSAGSNLRSKSTIGVSSRTHTQVESVERPKTTSNTWQKSRRKSYPAVRSSMKVVSTDGTDSSTESIIKLRVSRKHNPSSQPVAKSFEDKAIRESYWISGHSTVPVTEDRLANRTASSTTKGCHGSSLEVSTTTPRDMQPSKTPVIRLAESLPSNINKLSVSNSSDVFSQALSDLSSIHHTNTNLFQPTSKRTSWKYGPRVTKSRENKPSF